MAIARAGVMWSILLLAIAACGGENDRGGVPSFKVFAHTCDGTLIGGIDCDSIDSEKLWHPTSSENPELSAGKALTIAAAKLSESRLISDHFSPTAINLLPCGSGWTYVISFSTLIRCHSGHEPFLANANVVVLMDGETALPVLRRDAVAGKKMSPAGPEDLGEAHHLTDADHRAPQETNPPVSGSPTTAEDEDSGGDGG